MSHASGHVADLEDQVEGQADTVGQLMPRRPLGVPRVGEMEPSEISVSMAPGRNARGVDHEEDILSTLRARIRDDQKAEEERQRNSAFSTLVQNYNRPDAPSVSGPASGASAAAADRSRGSMDHNSTLMDDASDSKSVDHAHRRPGHSRTASMTKVESYAARASLLMRSQSSKNMAPTAGAGAGAAGSRGSLNRMDSWSRLAIPKAKQALGQGDFSRPTFIGPGAAVMHSRGRRATNNNAGTGNGLPGQPARRRAHSQPRDPRHGRMNSLPGPISMQRGISGAAAAAAAAGGAAGGRKAYDDHANVEYDDEDDDQAAASPGSPDEDPELAVAELDGELEQLMGNGNSDNVSLQEFLSIEREALEREVHELQKKELRFSVPDDTDDADHKADSPEMQKWLSLDPETRMAYAHDARVERRQQYERAVAEANNEHDLKALEIKFKLEEEAEVVRQRHLEELARKERKLELIKKKIDMERQRELRNRQEEKDRQIKVVQMKKGLHEQLKGMEKASSASKHEQELTAKRERAEREKRLKIVEKKRQAAERAELVKLKRLELEREQQNKTEALKRVIHDKMRQFQDKTF